MGGWVVGQSEIKANSASVAVEVEVEVEAELGKNWISLKSTQKWLLKNVQDGISRPLGSRVIQKTKRSRELRDTL